MDRGAWQAMVHGVAKSAMTVHAQHVDVLTLELHHGL